MMSMFKAVTSRNQQGLLRTILASICAMGLLAACNQRANDKTALVYRPSPDAANTISPEAMLGKKIFFDASLSASGKMACATCHSPEHAYGPPNDKSVQSGGPKLNTPGVRAVPSLRYVLNRTPRWSKQYQSNPIERMTENDAPPVGGFAWDGRFNSLHEQASAPLLAANEMANGSMQEVVSKIRRSAYATDFEKINGQLVWGDTPKAFNKVLLAIERFELEDPSFHPYTSRFDLMLTGKTKLNDQELRGLQLFADPAKGNCASCHLADVGADHSPPLFTDFGFSVLGAPRNQQIPANRDRHFYDLGLCAPLRQDLQDRSDYCGMFKTPGLRNVASRKVFLHNGVFHDLESVVRFYAERDTHPEKWFPKQAGGKTDKFNDLPESLRKNVDLIDAPLNHKKGEASPLGESDIRDIVAFLKTLTDQDVKGL